MENTLKWNNKEHRKMLEDIVLNAFEDFNAA